MIQNIENMPFVQFALVFEGKKLYDGDRTLAVNKITNKSVL